MCFRGISGPHCAGADADDEKPRRSGRESVIKRWEGWLDGRDMWRQVLDQLEATMNPANFDTWLRPTRVIGSEDGALIIGCPTTYVKEWLETRLLPSIKKAMGEVDAPPVQLRFRVSDSFPSQRPRTRRGATTGKHF